MQASHTLTQAEFEQFRIKSRETAQHTLPAHLKDRVGLSAITLPALAKARIWEFNPSRSDDASWDWTEAAKLYCYRHPKRFDLAIWYANTQLCGLSIGKPTYSGTGMRLDVVEGAPGRHPLKGEVVNISVAAFQIYAKFIGATQIRIMRPVNDEVTRHYEYHGFTLRRGKASHSRSNGTPTYLWKNL